MLYDLVWYTIFGSISVALVYIFLKIYWKLLFWDTFKFPQIEPNFFYGNLKPYIRHNLDFGTMLRNYYRDSAGEKYVGLYMIYKPALLLRDPNVIRTIFQNQFGSFCARKIFEEKEKCPLLDNFYQCSEDEWRNQRDLIAKIFTANNIAEMFDAICVTSALDRFLEGLTECCQNSIGINRLLERHLYNVMASVIFGTHINTISYADDYFRKTGQEALRPTFVDKLSLIRDLAVPTEWEWLHNLLNFRRHRKKIEDYYVSLTRHVLGRREYYANERNERTDYIQYLMKIRNRGYLYSNERDKSIESYEGGYKYMKLTQAASQAFLAFTSGFPTILSTMNFFLLEMAKNHSIQDRLSDEIELMFESTGGNPTLPDIVNMIYLDACVNEVLRKYPPITYLTRYCTNDYVLKQEKFTIEKGMPIFVSVLGIHHDPTYYPNPMEFDPRRFTQAELRKRPAITFIPFGFGPRNCVGMELAKAIVKVHLVFILSKYSVSVAPKMRNAEINFDKGHLNEINRIHLRFGRRMRINDEDD